MSIPKHLIVVRVEMAQKITNWKLLVISELENDIG